jgi:cell wall-associated NlpC family hydrolase
MTTPDAAALPKQHVMVGLAGRVAPSCEGLSLRIVTEARSWVGTRFQHQGDVKGVGIDCVMLALRVYQAAGVLPADFPDPRPYPRGWFLRPGDSRYRDGLAAHFVDVLGQDPQPGDLCLFQIGRAAAHSAIVIEWPRVVHAAPGECVIEDRADRNELGGKPLLSLWRPR